MDPVQLTLIIISFILTLLVCALGVQVFFILKEVRFSAQKMNKMLDDAGKVSGTVSDSVTNVAGFVNGLKTGLSVFSSMRGKEGEHGEEK